MEIWGEIEIIPTVKTTDINKAISIASKKSIESNASLEGFTEYKAEMFSMGNGFDNDSATAFFNFPVSAFRCYTIVDIPSCNQLVVTESYYVFSKLTEYWHRIKSL